MLELLTEMDAFGYVRHLGLGVSLMEEGELWAIPSVMIASGTVCLVNFTTATVAKALVWV
jgi:hypothetical protein